MARRGGLDDSGSPGKFSVGVLGLKVDDVNGDSATEIWCGDAAGRLYCLERVTTPDYRVFYRSESLGAYPGLYNTIFPLKVNGKTRTLVVFTPGYVYRFNVNNIMVPEVQ